MPVARRQTEAPAWTCECGWTMPVGSRFCNSCRARRPAPPPDERHHTCGDCGGIVGRDAASCPHCGATFRATGGGPNATLRTWGTVSMVFGWLSLAGGCASLADPTMGGGGLAAGVVACIVFNLLGAFARMASARNDKMR